jgi:hypothetical protein
MAVAVLGSGIGLQVAQRATFALKALMLDLIVNMVVMAIVMRAMPADLVLAHIAGCPDATVVLSFNRVHQCLDTI